MKNLKLNSLLSLLLLLFFSSCKDEDRIETPAEKDFGQVSFNISDDKTNTIYDEENNLRINWKYGDVVKISCAQSTPKEGAYTIEKSSDPTKGTLKGDPTMSLKWNPNGGEHVFYGAYPGDNVTIADSKITCKCNNNQTLINLGNNIFTPDMKYAYMVAKKISKPTSLSLNLDFKPAITTLDIEIPVSSKSLPVSISSLKVSLDNSTKSISTEGFYTVDCNNLPNNYTLTSYSNAPSRIDVSANISNVTIEPSKKAVFTLLLPPVNIEANTAIITAVIDGKTRTATIKERVEGGTRRTVKMGELLEKYPQELTIIPSTLSIPKGKDSTFIAVLKYSDESVDTLRTGLAWSSDAATVATVNQSTGLVKALEEGTATVTVMYGGKSATATVNVNVADIIYTPDSYYMWDAPVNKPYPFTNGGANPNYSTIVDGVASQSCANAPTLDELKMYLGAGVYWVTDGPTYMCPDGETYHTGLMVKKKDKIVGFEEGTAPNATSVTPKTGVSYQSLKDDYFFLPACGCYYSGSFYYAGTGGYYWSSTPYATVAKYAYYFIFNSGIANVIYYYGSYNYRANGFVPMRRL